MTGAWSHAHSWTLTGKEEQDGYGWLRRSIIYPLGLGEGENGFTQQDV